MAGRPRPDPPKTLPGPRPCRRPVSSLALKAADLRYSYGLDLKPLARELGVSIEEAVDRLDEHEHATLLEGAA